MKAHLSLLVLVIFLGSADLGPPLWAQDQTRSVQEELRRRSLYFGNVDGLPSGELEEATRRYQRRKGFAATGKANQETLRSLGLVRPAPGEEPPQELDWPNEPVLRSDEKIDSAEIAKAVGEETGIAPVSLVSEKVAKERGLRRSRPKGSQAAPVVGANREHAADSPFIEPQEVARFAVDYFRAMGSNDIKRQLRFYGDRVDYYANGKIDRRIIEQTLRRYHARWPSRRYKMGPVVRYQRLPERGEIIISFPISFTLRDGKRTVKGETRNRVTIAAGTVDPRISAISEERVRR